MTTRRSNHEGTQARQRKDGRWERQVMLDGERRTVYGRTKAEVDRKVRELIRRHVDGQPLTDKRIKVATWAETWKQVKLPADGIKQSTRDAYVNTVRLHVLPQIGGKMIGSVQPSDCEGVLLAMKAAKLSRAYRRLAHTAMRSLFSAAVDERLITVSPMEKVKRPAPGKSKARALTPAEALCLMDNLSRTPTLTHLVPFIAFSGTRRGEALGLRWEDVDEEEEVIRLRFQVVRDSSGLHLSSHKTEAEEEDEDEDADGGRVLPLTPELAEVLRQRRKQQIKDRMAAPPGAWAEDDLGLVFTTKLGEMIEPNNVNRAFREAAKRAGLATRGKGKVTPHSLRHSAATLLLASGVDEKVVAELLGHGVRTLRTTYQHVLREQQTSALSALSEAYNR